MKRLLALLVGCGAAKAPDAAVCEQHDGANVTIVCPATWTGETTVAGKLTVAPGGALDLDHAVVHFAPKVEDTAAFVIRGDGRLTGTGCRLDSGSGRQWNLEAHDAAAIQLDGCIATQHSGLRAFDKTTLSAHGGDLEELQLHDGARIALDGTAAYLVLFFGAGADAHFDQGELATGTVTREFAIANGTGVAALSLKNAGVIGWQIDVSDGAQVSVGKTAFVLALHLQDVTFAQGGKPITSNQPVDGDFAFGPGAPHVVVKQSTVLGLNFYLDGASDLTFDGAVRVIEPNAGGSSKVVFGAAAQVEANIAQTYDGATMELDGSTLVDDPQGLFPSFSAADNSLITLRNVAATPHARVQTVGAGRVVIDGGSGWTPDKLEEIDKQPGGGISVK